MDAGISPRAIWSCAMLTAVVATVGCSPEAAPNPDLRTIVQTAADLKDGTPGLDEASPPRSMEGKYPESAWLAKRTERYAGLFKGTRCDILLVPMQVEGSGFDRPSRDIMTAEFARALESTGQCVADPYLVDIALGDGFRRRNPEQALALARIIKAREIVTIYSGHYAPNSMRVTLQRQRLGGGDTRSPATMTAARSLEFAGYEHEHPAFVVFREHLPEMLASIGIKTNRAAASKVSGRGMPQALPASLDDYLHPKSARAQGALADAAALTFLAMQAPCEWRAADRLFAKAWVALDSADDSDSAVRRMRARILLHMFERPYALAVIGNDVGPEADGLRAVLNGNLSQARRAFAQVQGPWEKFFLGVEVVDLELAYSRDSRASTRQVLALFEGSPFASFVYRRLLDRNLWGLTTTRDMKAVLDSTFSPAGSGVLATVQTISTALSESAGPNVELASIRHLHRLVEEQPRLWCCTSFSPDPRASDLLDMLDSRVEHTLLRQAYFYDSPQARYSNALKALESYDSELAGNPHAESIRAAIYTDLLRSGELAGREQREQKLHAAAQLALWLNEAQTGDSLGALERMEPSDPALRYLSRVRNDYPIRPYWTVPHSDAQIQLERLAFSTDNVSPLIELLDHSSGDTRSRYLAELDSRFHGGRVATQRRIAELPANLKNALLYRSEIEADPDNWELYRAFAMAQSHDHAYADARRTILSYPPFQESEPMDPVSLSNFASDWGHYLLWRGAIDEAQPLLEKAAGYDTGSDFGGFSQARLSLLDARYTDAASWFLEIGNHYHDLVAYRELVSLQFAAGQDRAAWSLFDKLTGRYRTTGFWTAAMVGHRRAGLSATDLAKWYGERLGKLNAGENRDELREGDFLEQIIDRQLPPDLPGIMQGLASATDVVVHPDSKVYSTHPAPDHSAVIGPSKFGEQRHQKLTVQTHPPDRYVLAAEALLAMQGGKYGEAVSRFDELSSYYTLEWDWMLPYFAYSAAKTGDTLGLRAYLDGLPSQMQERFEVPLARAVFAAMDGKSDEAHVLLEKDSDHWQEFHREEFPHSGYQYINVCALLYEATGNKTYRDTALRMARMMRRVEPAFSYGHAAVAYLSPDAKERVDALATALYLDPASRWATKTPGSLQAQARALLASSGNPFTRGDGDRSWWKIDLQTAALAD